MADTFTAHYNLTKPQIGGDPDTWGTLLNANFDAIDTQMYANAQAAAAALPKAGGTITGNLAISGGTLNVNRTSTDYNAITLTNTSGAEVQLDANGNAEGNLRTTTNHPLTFITNNALALTLSASQVATFVNRPVFGTATPWDSANFNPANYAPLAGAAFTGAVNASAGLHVVGGTTAFNGQGAYLGWNRSAGSGETDLINHRGTGSGGFNFYNTDGTTYTQLSTLSSGGVWSAADFSASSDERLKTDIRSLLRGLDELKRMPPREYLKEGREEIGFIAQEAQVVIPEAVSVDPEGFLTLSYGQVVALVASAVLDLDARMALAGI